MGPSIHTFLHLPTLWPVYREIWLLATALLLLTNCAKKDTEVAVSPAAKVCRISAEQSKQLTTAAGGETITIQGKTYMSSTIQKSSYTYEDQGRLATQTTQYASSSATAFVSTYQYRGASVDVTTGSNTASPTVRVLTLNSQGYVQSATNPNSTNSYDKDGYLIQSTTPSLTIVNTISQGNVIRDEFTLSGLRYVTTYDYDLTKPSLPPVNILLGKPSANLLLHQQTTVYNASGGISDKNEVFFQYEYDQEGNISRKLYLKDDGVTPFQLIDYTYTCK